MENLQLSPEKIVALVDALRSRAIAEHQEYLANTFFARILEAVEDIAHENGCQDSCEAILDLLCVPKDNTVDSGACDYANAMGEWPAWGFCRDSYMDMWTSEDVSSSAFVEECLLWAGKTFPHTHFSEREITLPTQE